MKKLICLVLATLVAMSAGVGAYNDIPAGENSGYLSLLSTLKIMGGYEDGSFHPDSQLTRAQLAKIAVNISDLNSLTAVYAGTSPFPDVPYTHWAAGYVSVAVRNGILTGFPDGTFKPEMTVTYEQAITVCVRLLGYTDNDVSGVWPAGYIIKANSLGLTDGVGGGTGNPIARIDVAKMVYNQLFAKTKQSGGKYIESMGYKAVDDVIVIASNNEDGSIEKGSVMTSGGSYKIDDTLLPSAVGRKGDIVVDKNNKIIAFVPSAQKISQYVANAAGSNSLSYYDGGAASSIAIKQETTVYNKSAKSIWSASYTNVSAGDTVKVFSDDGGNIQYIVISKSDLAGPMTVMGDEWKSALGIKGSYKVIKNGQTAKEADIAKFDAVYYSATAGIVWAYDRKVTGIFENALPSRDKATSITVSGTSYNVSSLTATVKIGPDGGLSYGDTVVLIFGRDGGVVDVVRPSDNVAVSQYGFLNSTGTKSVVDANGNSQTVFFSKLTLPDGTTQELVTDTNYADKRGKLVRYSFRGNKAVLAVEDKQTDLYGDFSYANWTLGSKPVSKNVKILDVTVSEQGLDGGCISVYPQRIDGVSLSSTKILFYTKNANGEIDFILLDSVTGDGYDYGVVLKANVVKVDKEKSPGSIADTRSASYSIDINGKTTSYSDAVLSNVGTGQPAQFKSVNNKITNVFPLQRVDAVVKFADNTTVQTGNSKYLLGSRVSVYKKVISPDATVSYLPMSLNDIIGKTDLNITAFYDKSEKSGGRVRVLVVN